MLSKEEFATGGMDNTLRIWDLNKMSESNTLQGVKAFFDIDYSQHSKLIASGSSDRHVRLWDPRTTTGKVSQKAPGTKLTKSGFCSIANVSHALDLDCSMESKRQKSAVEW